MNNKLLIYPIIAFIFYMFGYISNGYIGGRKDGISSLSNAELDEFKTPIPRSDMFLSFGKLKINGVVIKIINYDQSWDKLTGFVIVPYKKGVKSSEYNIFEDRDVFITSLNDELVPITSIIIKTSNLNSTVKIDDAISIVGEYGKYGNEKGSVTSVPKFGIFAINPSDEIFIANQSLKGRM